jgi:hypothetical protein
MKNDNMSDPTLHRRKEIMSYTDEGVFVELQNCHCCYTLFAYTNCVVMPCYPI